MLNHNGDKRTIVVTNGDAVIAGRVMSKKSTKPKRHRLTITFGEGQKEKIDLLAKEKRTNVNTVIRWAIDSYLASNASKRRS
jgi:hypothetical protein